LLPDGICEYDDYIDRAHARSTTAENGYLPCVRARLSQCGIATVRAQIKRYDWSTK